MAIRESYRTSLLPGLSRRGAALLAAVLRRPDRRLAVAVEPNDAAPAPAEHRPHVRRAARLTARTAGRQAEVSLPVRIHHPLG